MDCEKPPIEDRRLLLILQPILVPYIRHQCHEARALNRSRKTPLPLGRKASATAVHHTGVWVHVVVKPCDVLVVDVMQGCVVSLGFFFCGHNGLIQIAIIW